MSDNYLYPLIIALVAMLFSAFFSGMEIAFVSSNKVRAEIDIKKGGLVNRILNVFYGDSHMFISTLLIGNNVVNVIYDIAMVQLLTIPLKPLVGDNDALLMILQTLIATVLVLIMCEFLPKAIFRINPNYSLRTFSVPLFTCYCILYPISRFTELLSQGLMRLLGIKAGKERIGALSV